MAIGRSTCALWLHMPARDLAEDFAGRVVADGVWLSEFELSDVMRERLVMSGQVERSSNPVLPDYVRLPPESVRDVVLTDGPNYSRQFLQVSAAAS